MQSILRVAIALREQLRASVLDFSKVTELPFGDTSLTTDHRENIESPGSKHGQSPKTDCGNTTCAYVPWPEVIRKVSRNNFLAT